MSFNDLSHVCIKTYVLYIISHIRAISYILFPYLGIILTDSGSLL